MTYHNYNVYDATDADVSELVRNIRHEDKLEMIRWTANGPEYGALVSYRQSDVCFAVYAEDGALLGLFGAKRDNLIEKTAVIWGLSTTCVNNHKMTYVAATKPVLDMIFRALPDVEEFHNWVDRDYVGAMKWIEWMGGTFSINGRRSGFGKSVFMEFYISNPHFKEEQ